MGNISFVLNFWDSLIAIISLVVSGIIAFYIQLLSKSLSTRDRFIHEKEVTKEITNIDLYRGIILADTKKYKPFHTNHSNNTYCKQGGELYTCIPGVGVQVILMSASDKIPVGLIPFEWIEIIREGDSEDNKPVIVCKFKGVKWYKNFRSPFKRINYIYKNSAYKEGSDPKFLMYTSAQGA